MPRSPSSGSSYSYSTYSSYSRSRSRSFSRSRSHSLPPPRRGPARGRSPRRSRSRSRPTSDPSVILRVRNLSRNVISSHLREIFGNFGLVHEASVAVDDVAKMSKGHATVRLASRAVAVAAVEHLDGAEVDGRRMHVSLVERTMGNPQKGGEWRRPHGSRYSTHGPPPRDGREPPPGARRPPWDAPVGHRRPPQQPLPPYGRRGAPPPPYHRRGSPPRGPQPIRRSRSHSRSRSPPDRRRERLRSRSASSRP